jgi:hypothetical protein
MCLAGASGAGAELLAALPHPDLHSYYVWVPMLTTDSAEAAAVTAERFAEPRARHYWDGDRRLARRVGEALAIPSGQSIGVAGGFGLAWDVYLAYPRGAVDLTRPAFWMHQLAVTHAPRLDSAEWRQEVETLLETRSL